MSTAGKQRAKAVADREVRESERRLKALEKEKASVSRQGQEKNHSEVSSPPLQDSDIDPFLKWLGANLGDSKALERLTSPELALRLCETLTICRDSCREFKLKRSQLLNAHSKFGSNCAFIWLQFSGIAP